MTTRGRRARRAVSAAALALLAGGCGAPLFGDPAPPAPRAPGEVGVVRERAIVFDAAGRLDWCHANNRIAFDRASRAGQSEIWTIDSFGQDERCLSCDIPGLPKGLRGNPSWHPSCQWLVIQVSNRHNKGGRYEQLAWGIHHDLWAIAADGTWAEPLVSVGSLGASLSPQISRDGARLAWSVRRATGRRIPQKTGQRTPGAENPWDGWHLAWAKLEGGRGRPRLGAGATLFQGAAGGGRYEADALVGDTLWFSRSGRAAPYVDDVYRVKLTGGAPENLTRSPGVWDERAKPSPGGDLVAFVSSAASDWRHPPDLVNSLRLELFVLARGGKLSRISSLNNVHASEPGARAVAGDHAWGPRGKEIALAYVVFTPDGALTQRIEVVELDGFH
jgi:hypothetical protein